MLQSPASYLPDAFWIMMIAWLCQKIFCILFTNSIGTLLLYSDWIKKIIDLLKNAVPQHCVTHVTMWRAYKKKFNYTQIRANKPTHTFTITMKALSVAETAHIISLLEAGLSVRKIQSLTGLAISTISRLHSKHLPDSPKSLGRRYSQVWRWSYHTLGVYVMGWDWRNVQDWWEDGWSTLCGHFGGWFAQKHWLVW